LKSPSRIYRITGGNAYSVRVPKYRVLEGAYPALAFLPVARLKVEGLGVILARGSRNREGAVVFVVDADYRPLQSYAASTRASHHLLFALKEINDS
jgi:hypothetical protein